MFSSLGFFLCFRNAFLDSFIAESQSVFHHGTDFGRLLPVDLGINSVLASVMTSTSSLIMELAVIFGNPMELGRVLYLLVIML